MTSADSTSAVGPQPAVGVYIGVFYPLDDERTWREAVHLPDDSGEALLAAASIGSVYCGLSRRHVFAGLVRVSATGRNIQFQVRFWYELDSSGCWVASDQAPDQITVNTKSASYPIITDAIL